MKVYVDGIFYNEAEAKISVFDHGLLYGDGVFEGIRFYNGRIFGMEEHIARLYDSARAIALNIPLDRTEMIQALKETVKLNGLSDGYVRLVVTRGSGSLGLNPYHCPKASVIIIAATIALYPADKYENGLALVTCSTRRPTPASLSPQVKSLNYLNNVMAKIEAIQGGAEEGLMLNEQGYVAECTGDNIFIIKNGTVATPPVSSGALNGITRAVAIEVVKALEIPFAEKDLTRYDIITADECFLTGTAAEIIAAVKLDGRLIADGRPGAITQRCISRFREIVNTTGSAIDG